MCIYAILPFFILSIEKTEKDSTKREKGPTFFSRNIEQAIDYEQKNYNCFVQTQFQSFFHNVDWSTYKTTSNSGQICLHKYSNVINSMLDKLLQSIFHSPFSNKHNPSLFILTILSNDLPSSFHILHGRCTPTHIIEKILLI